MKEDMTIVGTCRNIHWKWWYISLLPTICLSFCCWKSRSVTVTFEWLLWKAYIIFKGREITDNSLKIKFK